jgi:hypothetical protein
MGDFTFSLAQKITASGKKFDRLVALAKGGWTWSRTLVDYLDIPNLSSTRLKSYTDVNKNSEKIDVIQPLADRITGERILIFDDVADSGRTLDFAKKYMESLGAKSVTIATLCSKPRSICTPDYCAFTTTSWVIFPHEYREFIEQAVKSWCTNKVNSKECRSRLLEIGIPDKQIDHFLPKVLSKVSSKK